MIVIRLVRQRDKQVTRFVLLLACLLTSGCLRGIRLVGIDASGEKAIKVSKSRYEKELANTLAETQAATLKALANVPTPAPASQGAQNVEEGDDEEVWEMDYVMVGLGLEGQIGIANIITLRAFPRFRLFFTRE